MRWVSRVSFETTRGHEGGEKHYWIKIDKSDSTLWMKTQGPKILKTRTRIISGTSKSMCGRTIRMSSSQPVEQAPTTSATVARLLSYWTAVHHHGPPKQKIIKQNS